MSSGAEPLIPAWSALKSATVKTRACTGDTEAPLLLCPMEHLKSLTQTRLASLGPKSPSYPGAALVLALPPPSPPPSFLPGHLEKTSFQMLIKKVCHHGGVAALPPCLAPSAPCAGPGSEDGQGWSEMRSSLG